MVVAGSDSTLLTVCEHGYGKRTPFGPGQLDDEESDVETDTDVSGDGEDEATASLSGNMRYRRQKRGGKGLRDIRTSERNGNVIGSLAVVDGDDVLMISAAGKIQRIHVSDISVIGRNTQGVRIMKLDDSDRLVGVARIPAEVVDEDEDDAAPPAPAADDNGAPEAQADAGNGAAEPPSDAKPDGDAEAGNGEA